MLSAQAVFLILLIIGIAAGLLFDRFAGPGWLSRQIAGSNRTLVTSALVGVAGSFVFYHLALLIGIIVSDDRDRFIPAWNRRCANKPNTNVDEIRYLLR